tara:strand:+ start:375 stop:593 length:219 start_codon:yes stop_codon:yes gene_type:complete
MEDLSSGTTIAPMGALASIFAVISILVFSRKLTKEKKLERNKKFLQIKSLESSIDFDSVDEQRRQLEELFKK